MSTPLLECRDLVVRYKAFEAVRGISFEAYRGEILGLLGPNGAGKTSVIRALTTIVKAAGGSASICGHTLDDPMGIRSVIGVLPESNGYPPAQTGIGYLRYFGELFGASPSEADATGRELLDQFGLGTSRQPIGTYSRGMRQRLGLCRALVNRPEVVFLDEPTLGLDPAGQEDTMARFTRIAADDGTCVILCSHLLDEVERVCDRVAVMDRGELVATGAVDQVIAAADLADSSARLSDAFLALTAPIKEGVR
jgi:ABC-2 type transport system ATP-binding protein